MFFSEVKSRFGYKIFSEDGHFMNDVDAVKQIKCEDGKFRFLAFEVKHPREKDSGGQIFALNHILNIPLFLVEMDPTNTKLVSGLITDKSGHLIYETKTAWIDLDACTIKESPVSDFKGLSVRCLIDCVAKGKSNTWNEIPGVDVDEWYSKLNDWRSK